MLGRTNLGKLNPCENHPAMQLALADFLAQNKSVTLIEKNRRYTFQRTLTNENLSLGYSFELTHSLILRQRKPGKYGQRYEVLDDDQVLGTGADATVLKSLGVLIPQVTLFTFKSKVRAVKKSTSIELAQAEYQLAKHVSNLHMKPPACTFFEAKISRKPPTAFTVMRFFPGTTLQEIIEAETFAQLHLTTTERLALSLAILRAIKEQAHQHGIVHRDLKAENIMVHRASNQVNLIDFSYGKMLNDPDNKPGPAGTLVTMPPEQFYYPPDDFPLFSVNADAYSAGKTLAELWWAEPEVNIGAAYDDDSYKEAYLHYYQYAQSDTVFRYDRLLQGDLEPQHVAQLTTLLENLTRAHPEQRWSLEQAIQCLERIQQERLTTDPTKTRLCF